MSFAEDPVYRGLCDLRSEPRLKGLIANAWEDWSGAAPKDIKTEWLHSDYQPFASGWARVRARVVPSDGAVAELDLALLVFALPEQAEAMAENGRRLSILPCGGPPMFVRHDMNVVGWTLPNGLDLRALEQVLQPGSLSMLLEGCPGDCPDPERYQEPVLHRYEPSAYAIVRWRPRNDGPTLIAKLGDDERVMTSFSNAAKIAKACQDGELDIRAPMPLAFHQGLQTLVEQLVEGTTLTAHITGATAVDAFRAAGRALADLHQSSVSPSIFWSSHQDCEALTRQLDGFHHAFPDLQGRVERLVNTLVDRFQVHTPAQVPIHGEPTCGGIFYDDGTIGFNRWDALALGDPLHDVGHMVAHVAYLTGRQLIAPERAFTCIDEFRRGYRPADGMAFDVEQLSWHVAASLLLIGERSSLRRPVDGWEEHVRFVVDEAERVLDGNSAFVEAAVPGRAGAGMRVA